MAAPDISKELMRLVERNRDGAFSTQANRQAILRQIATDLKNGGFRSLPATGLKPKHCEFLVAKWKEQGLCVATMKNRMAQVRWWAEKVGKQNCVPRTNKELGIGNRSYVAKYSKARVISDEQRAALKDPHLRASIELQEAFGLRREECLKFRPEYALGGATVASATVIRLKDTWCKGGRPREVPITNERQREVLARALEIAGYGSLIPEQFNYRKQIGRYSWATEYAKLSELHGLRHAYAQRRYAELTGWPAPVAGGPSWRQFTPEQRRIDHEARMTLSEELGHSRKEITNNYLGR